MFNPKIQSVAVTTRFQGLYLLLIIPFMYSAANILVVALSLVIFIYFLFRFVLLQTSLGYLKYYYLIRNLIIWNRCSLHKKIRINAIKVAGINRLTPLTWFLLVNVASMSKICDVLTSHFTVPIQFQGHYVCSIPRER